KSTNPFARNAASSAQVTGHSSQPNTDSAIPYGSPVMSSPLSTRPAAATGTNPFARNTSPQITGNGGLVIPTPTGNAVTNPFRASVMMQQQQAQQAAQLNGNFSG